jgi:hypothetical protein
MAVITQPPTPQVPLTITPTIPSRQRIFNLVRGAFYALNRTDPSATEDCWLCLSLGPPYYEGIAFNGDFNRTSSHTSCSWGTGQKLTLTEVSVRNPGHCIGIPPSTHKPYADKFSPCPERKPITILYLPRLDGGLAIQDLLPVYQLRFLTHLMIFVS